MQLEFFRPATDTGVYMIRNRINKKVYVGSSVQIAERWRQHRRSLKAGRHHSPALQNAWNVYGAEAFEFFVIAYCTPDKLRREEQFWLTHHTAQYNSVKHVGGRRRAEQRPESCEVIAAKVRDLWKTAEFRERATRAMRGARRGGVTLEAFGKTKRLVDFAREYRMSSALLRYRLKAMPPEEALTVPVKTR